MDPVQVPLWKFLYQGLNNNWLIAYGSDVFVLPFDNIGTTVFVAELVQQLKSRNVDIDRLAGYRTRQQGTNLQQKEATKQMAKDLAQLMQSWLPTAAAPDPTSQQRILDLETEIAKLKAARSDGAPTPSDECTRNVQHLFRPQLLGLHVTGIKGMVFLPQRTVNSFAFVA